MLPDTELPLESMSGYDPAVAVAGEPAVEATVMPAQSNGVITCPGPYGFMLLETGAIWFNS